MRNLLNLIVGISLFAFTTESVFSAENGAVRIMPLGDSITAGYTNTKDWKHHPFEFGYRSGLYRRLKQSGYEFEFVGESPEPWDGKWGLPSNPPTLDLREIAADNHRGYGGWTIPKIQQNVKKWIEKDEPDLILLMVGINGISAKSPSQLDKLVKSIFEVDANVRVIVAQITPKGSFNQHLADYNTYIREELTPRYAAKGYKISTVDLYKLFLKNPKNPESVDMARLSNKRNHPTNALYDQMAEEWFQAISSILVNSEDK